MEAALLEAFVTEAGGAEGGFETLTLTMLLWFFMLIINRIRIGRSISTGLSTTFAFVRLTIRAN